MPLAPEFEATSRLIPTRRPSLDIAVADRAFSSARSGSIALASAHGQREVDGAADHQSDRKAVPVTQDGRCGEIEEQLEDRWLLYLQAEHGDEWHLFRVDLRAPADPPVDLTPLPPGARVFTVDALATAPGEVLVSMDERPSHVDYYLIDVETGHTTADLGC